MAVAVKTSAEIAGQGRLVNLNLALRCLVGAIFLFVAVGVLFTALPVLWLDVLDVQAALNNNAFLSDSLLTLVLLGSVAGLYFIGRTLEGAHPPRGLRAGAVFGAVALFATMLITLGTARWLASQETWINLPITVLVGVGLLYGIYRLLANPGFMQWLGRLEDLGWFHTTAFKPNQGLRVRRGTVFALLVLVLCGVYTMLEHRSFGLGDWGVDLPWGDNLYVPILLKVQYTVPLIFFLVLGWFSWRVVNWPVFADFLIATEAEMNKVSWTTRKRLVQDTVVVLTTVFLLTTFLFLVDVLWIWILSDPFGIPVEVLQINPIQIKAAANETTQW